MRTVGDVAKLRAVYDAIQPPDNDPVVDFDERDLIVFAEEAGGWRSLSSTQSSGEPRGTLGAAAR